MRSSSGASSSSSSVLANADADTVDYSMPTEGRQEKDSARNDAKEMVKETTKQRNKKKTEKEEEAKEEEKGASAAAPKDGGDAVSESVAMKRRKGTNLTPSNDMMDCQPLLLP